MNMYAGYTGRIKNVGEGFLNQNGLAAHIKTACIYIRELSESEIAESGGEYAAVICVPSNGIGSMVIPQGAKSIFCRSTAEAQSIMAARPHRNRAVQLAAADGWHTDPIAATKDAVDELTMRAAASSQRAILTRESAAQMLVDAGIFEPGWSISEKVWNKQYTRQRVQKALSGDPSAAGALKRDANKKVEF